MLLLSIGLHFTPFRLALAYAHSTVPLHRLAPRLVSVPVKIDTAGPFEFLLDTGSETSLIDSELAVRLHLAPIDRMNLSTAAGSSVVLRYQVQRLSVGEAELNGVELLSTDIPALRQLPVSVHGILGLNFLRNFSIRLDSKKLRLDLYSPGDPEPSLRGARLPIEAASDAIVFSVDSSSAPNGRWRFALDSGASHALVFEDRLPSQNQPRPESPASAWLMTTAAGATPTRGRQLATLQFAARKLRDVEIFTIPVPPHRPPSDYDGLFPLGMVSCVFIDFANRFVIFDPN